MSLNDQRDLSPDAEQYASDYAKAVLDELDTMNPLQAVVSLLYIHSNFIYNIGCDCKLRRAALVDEIANACHESFAKWDRESDI